MSSEQFLVTFFLSGRLAFTEEANEGKVPPLYLLAHFKGNSLKCSVITDSERGLNISGLLQSWPRRELIEGYLTTV